MKELFSKLINPFSLSVLIFLFFLIPLFKGKVPIPSDSILGLYHPWRDISYGGYSPQKFPAKNPLITDPVLQTYPWRYITVNNLKEGHLPLWNPYSFGGQPLLANSQSGTFQILNILFFMLPFRIAWVVQIILPVILSGLFMFLLLRNLKLSKESAFFGAFILPFSGFFLTWQQWGTIVTTAMWLPLILLAINKLLEKKSALFFLILTFSASQTFLSGHLQTALYVVIASVTFTAFKLNGSLKNLWLIACGFLLGLLTSTAQLLPTLEFIRLSAREIDQGFYPGRQDWFLPMKNLVQLIFPDYFGNPATYNYWGIWNYAEFVTFISVTALFLVLLGLLTAFKKARYFVVLAIFSLIFALKNPFSIISYRIGLPFLESLQPSRIIFLFVFALSGISAYGLESFFGKENSKKLKAWLLLLLAFGGVCFFTLIFKEKFPPAPIDTYTIALRNLIFPLISFGLLSGLVLLSLKLKNKPLLFVGILFLTLVELFRFGYKFSPFSKISWIFPQTEITNFLAAQQKPFRVMTTDRRILHPNTQSVYKIESLAGYDPLYLRDYSQLVSSWNSGKLEPPAAFNRIINVDKFETNLADLLNVKYVLTFDTISSPKLKKVFEKGETKIYENQNFTPRVFFVNEIIRVGNKEEELTKLLESNNLQNIAFSSDIEFKKKDFRGTAKVTSYKDQSLIIETENSSEAPLIISNVFYPGWKASIDSKPATINRANFIFQSVNVPEGKHTIKLQYAPKSFYNGIAVSIFSGLAVLLIAFYLWRTKSQ